MSNDNGTFSTLTLLQFRMRTRQVLHGVRSEKEFFSFGVQRVGVEIPGVRVEKASASLVGHVRRKSKGFRSHGMRRVRKHQALLDFFWNTNVSSSCRVPGVQRWFVEPTALTTSGILDCDVEAFVVVHHKEPPVVEVP